MAEKAKRELDAIQKKARKTRNVLRHAKAGDSQQTLLEMLEIAQYVMSDIEQSALRASTSIAEVEQAT